MGEANDGVRLASEADFRLGALSVFPSASRVEGPAGSARLEPRVMAVLVVLARARGQTVSRDTLIEACWGGRFVTDNAVSRALAQLRMLGRTQSGAFRIETIRKVGFQLIVAGAENAQTQIPDVSRADITRALDRRHILVAGGALAVVATGGVFAVRSLSVPKEARILIDDARAAMWEGEVAQVANAVGMLRRAVQIAPRSAEAWGLLALAYMVAARDAAPEQRATLRNRGEAAITRARALDSDQADAAAARVVATPQYRNWVGYDDALGAALRRHPGHPLLNYLRAYFMSQVGRTAEAMTGFAQGLTVYPNSRGLLKAHASALWDLGRLEEADAALGKAFQLYPRDGGVWFMRLNYLTYTGRAAEALGMLADVGNRPLGVPDWNFDLTAAQVKAIASGDRAVISQTVELWKEAATRGTGFTESAAIFAAFVGDVDEAYRLLEAFYFGRGPRISDAYFSKEQGRHGGSERRTFPLFKRTMASVRHDPRFRALTAELGLEDYWRTSGSMARINF